MMQTTEQDFFKMYTDYLRERLGHNVVVSDHGFLVYELTHDGNNLHIVDLYIKPKYRANGNGRRLVESVIKELKSVHHVTCCVQTETLCTHESIVSILKAGFKFVKSTDRRLYFGQEV